MDDESASKRSDFDPQTDFELIKDSKRVTDWEWYATRHPNHHLTEMVKVWIEERSSTASKLRSAFSVFVALAGLAVSIATVFGVWIAWQSHQQNRPESEQALDTEENIAIADGSKTLPIDTPIATPPGDTGYLEEWNEFFEDQSFKYFSASELLYLGGANEVSMCNGLNALPPRDLWPNIVPTVRALELLQEEVEAPISLVSIYRSPAYNSCVGGHSQSSHMRFEAVDFVVVGTDTQPSDWAAFLRDRRRDGNFEGGIGTYNSFVHLDTRGTNLDW